MFRTAILAAACLIVTSVEADDAADATFEKLLGLAKADPVKCDFAKLRAAFVESSKYNPYAIDPGANSLVVTAMDEKDFAKALAAVNTLLEKKPLDIEGHKMASFIHYNVDDKTQEARHMGMAKGLMAAITKGHDGKSFETAYPVLDVGEEYVILDHLNLKSNGQSLMIHDGKFYDIQAVKDPKTGDELKVYFDVSTPRKALGRMLRPKK